MRRTALLAAVVSAVAALAAVGSPRAAGAQELTLTASDGTPLACALELPAGAAPAGGWPAVLLFHGLGQEHSAMAPYAAGLAQAGYASLACDARGTGASGGRFGLDGPRETEDARDLFAWLAARPDVSDTAVGAFGISLGGAAVWNAAAAGVPFRAIVPAATWTSLSPALAPAGVPKTGLLAALAQAVPGARWDPQLAAAASGLLAGGVTSAVKAAAAQRSSRPALPSLATPTLIVQGRRDALFDLDQALAAYRLLQGPKALYVGDLGHPPAANPPAELPVVAAAVLAWFDRYLRDTPGPPPPAVVLAHDPWDGKTTALARLPTTRIASVALPGRRALAPGDRVSRSARLTGGPHESFGAGTVAVRYSGVQGWSRLVATVAVAGSQTPLSAGAVRIAAPAGVATIRLLDEVVRIPRGARLTVTLGASDAAGLFAGEPPAGATLTVGRVTLRLPLLRRAVSRP